MFAHKSKDKFLASVRDRFLDGGKPPPETGFKRIFNTPVGVFPKLRDVALSYGMFESNIHRRYVNPREDFVEWHVIDNPTKEQCDQAIDNANSLYLSLYELTDNCGVCNAIDDMLFEQGCWLTRVDHDHKSTELDDVVIHYSKNRKDYTVTYLQWTTGARPHNVT